MIGMVPPKPEGRIDPPGYMGEVIAQSRYESVREILPGEEYRAFYNLSAPKKLLIMAGGILANLLLALLFTTIAFLIPTSQASNQVASVSQCLPTADGTPCDTALQNSPAALAGLEPGDVITSFGGVATPDWPALVAAIGAAEPGVPVPVVVERGGQQVDLSLTPVVVARPAGFDTAGEPIRGEDGQVVTVSGPFVGIGPEFVMRATPISQVPRAMWQLLRGTVAAVVTFPVQVFRVAVSLFTGAPRANDGVMSVVGIGRVAAEVAGADARVNDIAATMISIIASLNMALFAFNLIPLLPFDGGHVVNALYEGAKRQIARIRKLPLPGPADVARTLPIAYVVVPLLVISFLVLIMADVLNPVSIFG
jgi:membrane-associated protease RseP (regulator of RpoE activity)